MAQLFSFPHPVNEKAARVVAGCVALACAVTVLTGWHWLLVPIAYGFVARVLTGPTLSPLGLLATKLAAPRLGRARYVSGPPKRFAQGIGAVCTTVAAVFALVLGWSAAADAILALMVVFASLEAAWGFCVGCKIFGLLIAVGAVPERTCAACADLGLGRG
ncbi:MAG: DUF4395 domain-containing protein [Actinomycetota bacterium]|nr:DUF4395 domain-containing protein [Actinomycetota bacterium]